ncbi:hypothetical protein F4680DRAFT_420115 [Xylaria scruposa]|nr:hypothetical protein F4680DRAFT_420115 [Xylaria scruposa]
MRHASITPFVIMSLCCSMPGIGEARRNSLSGRIIFFRSAVNLSTESHPSPTFSQTSSPASMHTIAITEHNKSANFYQNQDYKFLLKTLATHRRPSDIR